MLLSWIVGGILCLKLSKCQAQDKKICDIDPDRIYFENEELEKIRNLFILGGECSPIWKGQFNNVVQNHLRNNGRGGVSQQDRVWLKELAEYQKFNDIPVGIEDSFENENKRRLQSPNPPEIVFGSRSQYPSVGVKNDRNQRISDNIVSESQEKRQILQPDLFGFNSQQRPQGRPNVFRSNNQRPQNQVDFTSPNIQRRPQNQRFPEFFGGPNQRRPVNQFDLSPPGDVIPQNEFNFFPTSSQRRPSGPSGWRPQSDGLQDNAIVSDSQNNMTPEIEDGFFPSVRPQNQIRPSDVVMSDRRTPQPDVMMPDNQRPDAKKTVIQRPQMTTSSRLETTTLPGPPTWATAPSVCVRDCPNTPEYNPVCGSDRITYRNPGRLRCEQRCGKANVDLNYYGTCVTTTTPEPRTTARTSPVLRSANDALFRLM